MITRIALGLFVLAALTRDAIAATPDWSLREYVQTTWTHRDGTSLAGTNSIIQTSDGYLWFIAGRVLIRFDGVKFVTVPVPCDRVYSLEASENGSLWVLCRDQQYRLFRRSSTGQIAEVPLNGLPSASRKGPALFVDSRGRLWVYANGVARLEPNGRLRELGRVSEDGVISFTEDSAGIIWLSTEQAIIRIQDDRLEHLPVKQAYGLAPAPSGGVLECAAHEIQHLAGTSRTLLARAPPGLAFVVGRRCLTVDSDGTIWAATQQHGVARIQSGRVETSLSPGEPGAYAHSVFLDREGNIWVASSAGLHRFRKPHARLLSSVGARLPPQPLSVFVDSRDDIWITGTRQFVRVISASGVSEVFAGIAPHAFAEDDDGRIWLATEEEIGRLEGGTFRPVRDISGAPVPRVQQFQRDANGNLWAVAFGVGVYQVSPGPPHRVLDVPDAFHELLVSSRQGVWVMTGSHRITQFVAGREPVVHGALKGSLFETVLTITEVGDAIWVGDSRGLHRWRNGRWTNWARAQGLPAPGGVQEIATDGRGRLWLMTYGGILALSQAELDAMPDGAPGPLRFVQIGALDRVVPHPGSMTSSPRVGIDRAGRLYFATVDSVAIVDPSAVTESSLRPTIALEAVVVDNHPVDSSLTRRFTAPSRLQFEYTSLSLRSPENIRFRYRLEGYDEDWIDAGNARQVTYGTLPPRSYRFHVIGSGSEGVWNEDGASYAFQIIPVFYNAWWFRTALVAAVVAGFIGMHRFRVRRLAHQMTLRFEERLGERTRIAQDLHDTLLQGTLAASMHVQLANDALAEAAPSPAVEEARSPLRRAVQLLSQVAEEGRATLSGLRTHPGTGDIADMLHEAAMDQPNYDAIEFRVTVEGAIRPLKPQIVDEIGGIAREAVVNAYKHAHAGHIDVGLIYAPTQFTCTVRDDGQGMQQAVVNRGRDGHWGLSGMRERAERVGAELHLRSRATAGTEVELTLTARLAYRDHVSPSGPRWWQR